MQKVQKYFSKAEFYEKAIEILNKQKEIAENMLFDYQLVSNIVVSDLLYDFVEISVQDFNLLLL